jgi:transposase
LLLSRWVNLNTEKKRQLNQLFNLNRRVPKACLLKESRGRLGRTAMTRYLQIWMINLDSNVRSFERLAGMQLDHLEAILNYCRRQIATSVAEAINGIIKVQLRRNRGYKNLRYLLLKAQRVTVTRTAFVTLTRPP